MKVFSKNVSCPTFAETWAARRAHLECGGKRSATPLCNRALIGAAAYSGRGAIAPQFQPGRPQFRPAANPISLQSAVDAALCRRTPKNRRFLRSVNPVNPVQYLILLFAILLAPLSLSAQSLTTLSVASGESHSLALRSDGTVWAWGTNDHGQLAQPLTITNSPIPVRVAGITNAVAIAAGRQHSLAIMADGRIAVWGKGTDGQLGTGTTDQASAIYLTSPTNAIAAAGGDVHSLVLLNTGAVMSFGKNTDIPRLGVGDSSAHSGPVAVTGTNVANVVSIAASWNSSFAARNDGTVWAWGGDTPYLLGISGLSSTNAPAQITTLSNVVGLAAGNYHALARQDTGSVWGWGTNTVGQLGFTNSSVTPLAIPNFSGAMSVAAGRDGSAAVMANGQVYQWGYDAAGSTNIILLYNVSPISSAARGYGSTIMADADGFVEGLGVNDLGQLGAGYIASSHTDQYPGRCFGARPVYQTGRFIRGTNDQSADTAFVIPMTQQQGVALPLTGGDFYQYGPSTAWFSQIQRDVRQEINSSSYTRIAVQNPVAAFGSGLGATPLYSGMTYTFGVYAGGLDETTSNTNAPNVLRISAFPRTNFTSSATNLTTTNIVLLTMPRRTVAGDSNAWISFMANGALLSVTATNIGLTTTVEFVGGGEGSNWQPPWGLTWYTNGPAMTGFTLAGYKVSHLASDTATNYYFLIEALGSAQTNTSALTQFCTNSSGWAYAPMYTLDFNQRPRSNVIFVDQPHFDAQPLPSFYDGKSAAEIAAQTAAQSNLTAIWIYTNSAYIAINNSPEIRTHPLLDKLVSDLNKDPVAIANFVQNEIGLVDPIGLSGNGTSDPISVSPAGVSRSALGTYLERQGSPIEQCALLVYLLRKAGYPAAYVWPTTNTVQLLDTRLSRLLRMQLKGVPVANGGPFPFTGNLIQVNYPWVVLNLTNNRCIHLFPWLKDYEMTQGFNVWDYMPSSYNTAAKWCKQYVLGDTNILSLDPENNLPLYLLPKFIEAQIAATAPGLSIDDFGVKIENRRHNYARWEDFPLPDNVINQSQAAVVDTLSATNAFLNSIFDTFQVQSSSTSWLGTTSWDSGQLRMADLNDRKFVFQTVVTNEVLTYLGMTYTNWYSALSIYLAPYFQGVTNASSDFVSDPTLLGSQTGQTNGPWATFPSTVPSWTVNTTYRRHRIVGTNSWAGFLYASEADTRTDSRPLASSDIAGLVFNIGAVTPQMLKVHADDYIRVEENRAATNNVAPAWYDYQGTAAYLMGMGYYENESRFARLNEQLTGVRVFSLYDVGLSKLTPRTVGGKSMVQGNVDMPHNLIESVANNTSRPDLGDDITTATENWLWLFLAHGSAAEHYAINSTLSGKSAISTVRLLQLAQQRANASGGGVAGIVELNARNYQALGGQTYSGWGSGTLASADPTLWSEMTNYFNSSIYPMSDYVRAFVTPGLVTNEVGSYIGMGAFIVGSGSGGAGLISANGVAFGGAGDTIDTFDLSASSSDLTYSIANNPLGGYSFSDNTIDIGANRDVFSPIDATSLTSTSATYFQPSVMSWSSAASYWTGDSSTSYLPVYDSEDRGFFGASDFVNTALDFVADPVNTVSGEFYIDNADLTLPGPFPLQLRRNYLSQNQSQGLLGFGWKLNLMPYLFATTNTNSVTLMLAATPDGSVIAFRKLTNGTYTVDVRDNALLSNDSQAGIGGVNNWFNASLVCTTNSGVVTYTLTEPNGSVRTYGVRSDFGIGSGSKFLGRVRPYLNSWQDSRGNTLSFVFGTNNTATDFGEVSRIESANGNALIFNYDAYGRIVEAFTRDGRRVAYDYDFYGDLTRVTLPDASEVNYAYQHRPAGGALSWDFSQTSQSSGAGGWVYYYVTPANDYTTSSAALTSCQPGSYWNTNVPPTIPFWGYSTDHNVLVGPGSFSVGSNSIPEAVYYTPRAGTINIAGDITGPTSTNSDGVYVRIYSAGYKLILASTNNGWVTIPQGGSLHVNLTNLSVAAGQYIAFQVNPGPANNFTNDYVLWDPLISYTDSIQPYSSTHLLITETKPNGRLLQNVYDSQRRVATQMSTVGQDMRLYTNATFVYTQTQDNTNSGSSTLTGNTVVTDINSHTITYGYAGSLITNVTDTFGSIRQDWYATNATAPGFPRSLLRSIDKRGFVHQYLYDSAGNVTNTLMYVTNAPSDLVADLTGDGTTVATATATYGTNNLPISITDPSGNAVTNTYSGTYPYLLAQSVRYASGGTAITTNVYTYYNTNTVTSDGINNFTNSAYGLLLRSVSGLSATSEWRHDGRGYVTQQIGYPATADCTSSDPIVTNTLVHNFRGELVEADKTNGRKTVLSYDGLGRLNSKEVYDEFGNALSREFTYHNDNGEVVWIDGAQSSPEDYIWRDYDGAGRLTSEIRWRSKAMSDGAGVEAEVGNSLYAQSFRYYDGFNNLTNSTDALGNPAVMSYDALGRMTNVVSYDATSGTAVAVATNSFTYEPGGQREIAFNALGGAETNVWTVSGKPALRKNADGSTNGWTYYNDGRPKKEVLVNGSYWLTTYQDASRQATRVFYTITNTPLATNVVVFDSRGNVASRTDAAGQTTAYTYDGLNRLKSATGPVFDAFGHRQQITYSYDASGAATTIANALGETTVVGKDALDRVTSIAAVSASGATNRYTAAIYSTNNNVVTQIEGIGATAITNTVYADTFGKRVLAVTGLPGQYQIERYDLLGELISHQDELGQITTFAYDGLHRPTTTTTPDGKSMTLGYDPAGDLITRTMPGSLVWSASHDAALRKVSEQLVGGSTTNRQFSYQYYASGPNWGLRSGMVDKGRSITNNTSYDAWLHVASAIWTDGTAADAVTNAYTYDARELLTGLTQTLGTGTNTAISRSYDAQADLTSETVSLNGITESTFNQTWNAAGRRSNLAAQNTAMSWAFGYQADGQMTGVTANNRNYNFAYDLNGLLTSRSNPWRTQQFIQRDANGRPRVVTDTVGPSTALTEVLTYRPDSKISSYTATRQGNGAWNEARGFVYNSRGQLISEGLGLTSGATVTDTHSYDANGLGVHIGSVLSQGSTNNWSTTLDAFSRPLIETANINGATVHASGLAVGSSSLGVTLNSVSQGGAVFDPRSPDGKWKLDLGVPTGNNTVVATGTLPISGSTTSATNTFNVLANEATTNSYDAAGNLFSRNLTGPRTQNLTWDGLGRLVNVRQVDTNNCGLSFASIYDGLGRRIRTIQNTLASNTNVAGSTVTIDYFHDPQVEFLDLGVAVNGARTWKVYGPDLSGGYGALQGIGGLESTIRESDGQTVAFITDAFGNTLGTSPLWNQVNWTAMRFGSFGPVESFQPLSLSPSVSVSDASLHRGKIMDPTGLYCYGARFVTAHGVLISPDPMGFTASLGGLYEYGRNDLVNNVDPDGRFALGAWHGISVRFAEVFQNQDPNAIDHEMDVGSTAFRLGYQAGYYSPEIASVVVPEVLGAAFAEVGIAAARVARGVEGATMAVEALDEGALASEALVEGRAAVGAAEDVASALAEREALRQRVLANLSESAESRKSTGFADYLAGEANDANAAKTAPIRSNADLVTEIVSRADDWGTGQGLGLGPRAGSLKHGYADRLLTRYQRLYGDRGLSTEVPYLNGQSGVGGRGSIRLDVVEGALDNPTAIFDYKFGGAVLTPERIQQIRRVGQFGPNVPITAVHP